MSAFSGKADMAVCGSPLSRSLLGAKRTSHFAAHMSAYDPKRTSVSKGLEREAPPKRGDVEKIYLRTFRLPADSLPLSETIS